MVGTSLESTRMTLSLTILKTANACGRQSRGPNVRGLILTLTAILFVAIAVNFNPQEYRPTRETSMPTTQSTLRSESNRINAFTAMPSVTGASTALLREELKALQNQQQHKRPRVQPQIDSNLSLSHSHWNELNIHMDGPIALLARQIPSLIDASKSDSTLRYAGFFRASELCSIKSSDIKFHDEYVEIKIRSSKTDIYRRERYQKSVKNLENSDFIP
ncbi:uncharacterized protein [Magallana gigas]|uniref:uncharacterized protein isoform X2 n=1 Tax=Magallana gigas TaxID=29159 RepID=UPI00333FAB1B